ncbi:MAG: hypothetical protein GY851_26025 [bacterium]|nr:hypothetical protein [bacterium]
MKLTGLPILAAAMAVSVAAMAQESIPFPEALNRAAISFSSLSDPINDALILGNGDLNVLVFAEGDDLVVRITKNDVWDGRLDTPLDPPLPTLRRLLELGEGPWPDRQWILPEGSDWEGPDSYHAHPYPCPRACGVVRFPGAAAGGAFGSLDLGRAVASIVATDRTQCYVAADRNVIVVEGPAAATLEAIVSDGLPAAETGEAGGARWILQDIPGDLDWPGMQFAVAMASANGRTCVSVATSVEGPDPLKPAQDLARATLAEDTQASHERVWSQFWSRSGIELGDEVLERVWYRNLYFLRCVTREGAVSPGLFAGLLTDAPAWHGDYHTNYNIQQTFWTAYSANQCELAEPYDALITSYLPRARWLARTLFEMDGAFFPHVLYAYEPLDPAACASPNGRQYIHHVWAFTLGVTGFTVQPLWWRYKYAPDPGYLENVAYPAVRDVAVFYQNFVSRCPRKKGRIVLMPTVSPEHHGWTPDFKYNRDCSFCIAYFHYIFDAAIEGAETLGCDADLVKGWRVAKRLLPDYPRWDGGDGDVVVDVAGAQPITYNIPVPTTPVFPGDVIERTDSAEQLDLFQRTLGQLKHNGNNAPVMLAIARARLGTPDARDWLRTELLWRERRNGTLSFNRLEPRHGFNDYGHYTEMFGAALAVTETVLQSVGDVVRVFPAWPRGVPARFESLRAQGGFLVSAEHSGSEVTALRIVSTVGGPLTLELPWPAGEVSRDGGATWSPVSVGEDRLVRLGTEAGEVLTFRVKKS